jgi:hypothetical protein
MKSVWGKVFGIDSSRCVSGSFHKLSKILGSVPKSPKYSGKFQKFWEILGNFGNFFWELLGIIPDIVSVNEIDGNKCISFNSLIG